MPSIDPWAHRCTGLRCATCMWFVRKIPMRLALQSRTEDAPEAIILGRCRRRSPTMGGYPVVFGDDWCGEHKLDENKVVGA